MKARRPLKVISLILAAACISALLFSSLFIACHACHHHCAEIDCPVCRTVDSLSQILRSVFYQALLFAAGVSALYAGIGLLFHTVAVQTPTLFLLKTKLNN